MSQLINDNSEIYLDETFDEILYQLSKGNTIVGLDAGKRWIELEQIKEWKSRFGYQFHIYSNDHFIDNKPHFHLRKQSDKIDCRFFFNGDLIDCKGKIQLDKKVIEALNYLLSKPQEQLKLKDFWNRKNPTLLIKS